MLFPPDNEASVMDGMNVSADPDLMLTYNLQEKKIIFTWYTYLDRYNMTMAGHILLPVTLLN